MTASSTKKRKLEDPPEDSSFPPPFTSKTLEERLQKGIMVQSGGQKGSLTRCVQIYALLAAAVDDAAKQTLAAELQQELEWYRLDLTKSVLLQRNLQKEIALGNAMEQELEQKLDLTLKGVQESQQQAKRAKQVQSCFVEYEALSQLANTCLEQEKADNIRSTGELKQEIARVKQEINSQQQEESKLDSILAVRKNQFHLLIQCMLDLKRSLDNDEDDDEEEEDHEEPEDNEEKEKETEKGNAKEEVVVEDELAAMQVDEEGAVDDDALYAGL